MALTIEELAGTVLPAMGEVDDVMWEAVSGGQPVVLTRRGRTAAVVLDADTYAEMLDAAGVPGGAW